MIEPLPRPAGRTHPALPAAPLCPKVPVLAILDLAAREAKRRPLILAADADDQLEAVRRHVHEEHCPTCGRWYRNARNAYLLSLKEQLRPFKRPLKHRATGADYVEYGFTGRASSAGLGALDGRVVWTGNAGWHCTIQFHGDAAALGTFDAVMLDTKVYGDGWAKPVAFATQLDLSNGVLTSPAVAVGIDRPLGVRRAEFHPRLPAGLVDL